jgi:hypothetical protein
LSRNSVSFALSVFVFAAASAVFAADPIKPDAAEPVVAFDGQTVKASNITPGAQVVFFATGLVPTGYESSVQRWSQVVTDDDRDGAVTLDAGQKIPFKSIWVIADLTNGHFAVAAPPDAPLLQVAFDKRSLRKNDKGDLELFLHSAPFVDFLYVHPGKGAWKVYASDSHPSDADGQSNGVTGVALSNTEALAGDPKPKDFVPGGILVAIDLYRLNVIAERLDGQVINALLKGDEQ